MRISASRSLTCSRCGEKKADDQFSSYAYTTSSGARSTRIDRRCKPCMASRQAAKRAADPRLAARQSKAARDRNPAAVRQRNADYRASEHGKRIRAKLQRMRKARMRSGQGDNEEIRAIYAEALRIESVVACCPVFDLPELGKKMHVDHRTPLARGGHHVPSNLQILPSGINLRKWAKCG